MRLNCPHCQCHRVRPEDYPWYEKLLALLLLGPFRCLRCRTRFIRFSGLTLPRKLLVLK